MKKINNDTKKHDIIDFKVQTKTHKMQNIYFSRRDSLNFDC